MKKDTLNTKEKVQNERNIISRMYIFYTMKITRTSTLKHTQKAKEKSYLFIL